MLCRSVLLVGSVSCPFPPLPPHHLRPAGRVLGLGVFSFALPLLPAPPCLLASYSPPPAGRGMRGLRGRSVAADAGGTAICLLLIVSCRSLAIARSLLSCLRFGFSSRASFFFLLAWSGLVVCHRGPSSLLPVFPVPCVSCFVLASRPRLIHPVRLSRRSCLPARPRLGDSVGRCHHIGAAPCFSPSASAVFRLSPGPASRSLCLVRSSRPVPSHLGFVAALVRSCPVPSFAPPCLS